MAAVIPLKIVNGTLSQILASDSLSAAGIDVRTASTTLAIGGVVATGVDIGAAGSLVTAVNLGTSAATTSIDIGGTATTTVNVGMGGVGIQTINIGATGAAATSTINLGGANTTINVNGSMVVDVNAQFDGNTIIGTSPGTDGDTLTVYAMTTFTPGRVTGSIDFLKETAGHALTVQDSTTRTVAGSSLSVKSAAGASDGGVGGVLSLKSGAGGELVQGTNTSFANDGVTTTFVSTQALFVAGDVGRTIRIAGATSLVNDGDYTIASYISASSVTWLSATNVTEAGAGTWEFTSVIGQAGGAVSIISGTGGAGSADLAAGAGGAITILAGGAGAGAVGGAGGALTLSSGAPTGTGLPGTVAVQFGGSNILTVDIQGHVALKSIADDTGNNLDLSTGNNSVKAGGALSIFTGSGGSGSNPIGGKISITAGDGGSGSGTAEGGPVWITAGNGTTGLASTGGAVQIVAGNGGTVNGGSPGGVTIRGGNSTLASATGGDVSIDVGTTGAGNPPRILIGPTNAGTIYSGRGVTYNTIWTHRGALNVLTAANAQQFQIQDDAGGTPKLRLDMTSTGTAGTAPVAAWSGRLDAGTSKYTAIFSFGEDTNTAVPDPIMTFISGATPEGAITAPEGSTCHVQYSAPNANDGLWVKSTGVGNTGWAKVATGTGGGATLQTAYDAGAVVALDGTGGIQFNQADGALTNAATLSLTNAEDGANFDALTVNRSPVTSAAAGDGVGITMGANALGTGLSIAHAGAGRGIFSNSTGGGIPFEVQRSGAPIITVSAAGQVDIAPTSGQSFTVNTAGGGGSFDISSVAGPASGTIRTGTFLTLTAGSGVLQLGNPATNDMVVLSAAGAITAEPKSGQDFLVLSRGGATAINLDTTSNAGTGAINLDSAAGISLDAVGASNFTVSGAFDLTFNARGGTAITLNQSGDTALNAGFAPATSIIGALNKLYVGAGSASQIVQSGFDTATNSVTSGLLGYLTSSSTIVGRAKAAGGITFAGVFGANEGTVSSMTTAGTIESQKVEATVGPVVIGDRLYLSPTDAGCVTNVVPSVATQVILPVGYARTGTSAATNVPGAYTPGTLTKLVNTMILTDSVVTFLVGDVGKTVRLSGFTNPLNNGDFPITNSTTTLEWTNAAGVASDTGGSWRILGVIDLLMSIGAPMVVQ